MRTTRGMNWGRVFALVLLAIVGAVTLMGGFETSETTLEDMRARMFAPARTNAKVAVVLIDEEDMKTSPWNRPVTFWGAGLGELLTKLHQKGAKVIALDLVLSGDVDNAVNQVIRDTVETADLGKNFEMLLPSGLIKPGDRLLEQLSKAVEGQGLMKERDGLLPKWLEQNPNSSTPNALFSEVLSNLVDKEQRVVLGTSEAFPLDPIIDEVEGVAQGSIEVPPSTDAKIRELYFITEGEIRGLAYQAALAAGLQWTDPAQGTTYRFAQARKITMVPLADALADEGQRDGDLKDALVFIGLNKLDLRSTALQAQVPGVVIQANGTAALLDRRLVGESKSATWFALALSALSTLWLTRRGVWVALAVLGVSAVLWVAASLALYRYSLILLPIAAPVSMFLATWVGLAVGHGAQAERLRNLMGPIVSPRVLQYLLETPEEELRNGRWYEITALFMDMRDSTRHCATLPAATFSALINDLFQCTIECVGRHGGYVSRLTGDGFFAIFGFPDDDQSADREAVLAALEMVKAVEQFNRTHRDRETPWRVGIGIHSGPLLIAAVGPPERWELTAVGETVNLASRMESLSKVLGTTIVISEKVRNGLPADDRAGFVEHPNVEVKGSGPMTVFSLGAEAP